MRLAGDSMTFCEPINEEAMGKNEEAFQEKPGGLTERQSGHLCDVMDPNGPQGARLDTIPAAHAHVLKNHGLFEGTVDLFEHLVGAGFGCSTPPVLRIAFFRTTDVEIQHGKCFLGLHVPLFRVFTMVGWRLLKKAGC